MEKKIKKVYLGNMLFAMMKTGFMGKDKTKKYHTTILADKDKLTFHKTKEGKTKSYSSHVELKFKDLEKFTNDVKELCKNPVFVDINNKRFEHHFAMIVKPLDKIEKFTSKGIARLPVNTVFKKTKIVKFKDLAKVSFKEAMILSPKKRFSGSIRFINGKYLYLSNHMISKMSKMMDEIINNV